MSSRELSDEDKKQIITRNTYHRHIGYTWNANLKEDTVYMSPEFCKTWKIKISPLSIEEDSDCKPFFFAPFTGKLVPRVRDDGENGIKDGDKYDPELEPSRNLRNFTGVIYDFVIGCHEPDYFGETNPPPFWMPDEDIGCRDTSEGVAQSNNKPPWQTRGFMIPVTNPDPWRRSFKGPNKPKPHVKILIESQATGNKHLLRSEIMMITQIMVRRLHKKTLRDHLIIPLMFFSLTSPWHLRVVEAYYDSETLHVCMTKLYDMREANDELCEVLCRWWWGPAAGNTKEHNTPPI
ncbi:uncharacterized protein N7483_000283 [Penicillium malachiteum]|uniref:uncharacterized protein n=1 Tax=Penicillium malachiteum TaxID=1324776 RepID=UPI0025477D05|nr:uncharacterized protein N7483_000283 [Penicillium malachiteum]KAJ5735158.1 hypothetical protein N7483_000283 [Penicillium malachiteum]